MDRLSGLAIARSVMRCLVPITGPLWNQLYINRYLLHVHVSYHYIASSLNPVSLPYVISPYIYGPLGVWEFFKGFVYIRISRPSGGKCWDHEIHVKKTSIYLLYE